MPRLEQVFDLLEQSTATLQGTLTANDGVTPLPAASLTALTLSLYVVKGDGTISYVNSRNSQNVLNANNVSVNTAGLLTWTVQAADTTLVEALDFERHYALFTWTWAAGKGRALIAIVVQNLPTVT